MNARSVTLSVVLFALIFIAISPQTEAAAGICVIDGDQCFNTTYTTQGGGRNLVPTLARNTADDQLIKAANNETYCKGEASGTFYDTEDFSLVPLCQRACCCDSQNLRPPQTKEPAQSCLAGYDYKIPNPGESCTDACSRPLTTPPVVCGEGSITSSNVGCVCGTTPTTSADVSSGNFCCWDGSIRSDANSCQAKPGGACAYNTAIPVNTECMCGNVKIQKTTSASPLRVCCSGGVLASTPDQCTSTPITAPSCGDLKRQDPEKCDAQYRYALDPDDNEMKWMKVAGEGSCDAGEFCTASCACEKERVPVPGDGICDSTERTDDSNPDCVKREACTTTPFPTPQFKAEYRPATQSAEAYVQLNWTASVQCRNTIIGFEVYRSQTNALNPAAGADKSWLSLPKTDTGVKDLTLPSGSTTTLYYVLRTFYQTPTGISSADSIAKPVFIPSDICPGASTSYCIDATKGVNCKDYNATSLSCTGDTICKINLQDNAECARAASSCESCNGLFGMFPDPNAVVKIGNQDVLCGSSLSTCYRDVRDTSVNVYNSCKSISGCSGYRTKTSCVADSCSKGSDGTPTECLWISNDGGQTETQGYCQTKDTRLRKCSDCNSFGECNKDVCESINETCYYLENEFGLESKTITKGCYDASEQFCEMYQEQESCEGSTTYDLNPNTHAILSTSTNKANLPKCRWLNDKCMRDADKDSDIDVRILPTHTMPTMIALLRDFTNPMTVMNAIRDRSYPKEFSVRYTTEKDMFACFTKRGEVCTPGEVTGGTLSRTFETSESGLWNITYYGRDQSKNLELVGSFGFRIDATPPVINISKPNITSFIYGKDAQGNNVMRARLSTGFNVSENASCTTQLNLTTQSGSNPVYSSDATRRANEIINVRGQAFTIDYRQLADGVYRFGVTCVDDAMNIGANSTTIPVDTNADISGVSPQSDDPPLRTYTMTLKASTSKKADCRYGPPGTSYAAMTGSFSSTDGLQHTKTITPGSYTYRYQVACKLRDSGAEIYGGEGDEILFSIDRTAPKSVLCNATTADNSPGCDTTPFLNRPEERQIIKLRCTDYPLSPSKSFGCDKAQMRSCVQAAGEPMCQLTSNKVTYDLSYTNYIRKLPVKLHYQAIDKGGNLEELNTVEIALIDKTAPRVTFEID